MTSTENLTLNSYNIPALHSGQHKTSTSYHFFSTFGTVHLSPVPSLVKGFNTQVQNTGTVWVPIVSRKWASPSWDDVILHAFQGNSLHPVCHGTPSGIHIEQQAFYQLLVTCEKINSVFFMGFTLVSVCVCGGGGVDGGVDSGIFSFQGHLKVFELQWPVWAMV